MRKKEQSQPERAVNSVWQALRLRIAIGTIPTKRGSDLFNCRVVMERPGIGRETLRSRMPRVASTIWAESTIKSKCAGTALNYKRSRPCCDAFAEQNRWWQSDGQSGTDWRRELLPSSRGTRPWTKMSC